METQIGKMACALDAERRRLARILHDVMGHSLGRVLLELELLDTAQDAAEITRLKRSIRDRVGHVVSDLERLARGLHPPALSELGLLSGVKQYAQDFEDLHAIPVRVSEEMPRSPIPQAVAAAAFRVVQEGLLNIALHARATNVEISVRADDALEVSVLDDGVGLGPAFNERTSGTSLAALNGWVQMLGGELELRNAERRGAVLSARIPVEAAT